MDSKKKFLSAFLIITFLIYVLPAAIAGSAGNVTNDNSTNDNSTNDNSTNDNSTNDNSTNDNSTNDNWSCPQIIEQEL